MAFGGVQLHLSLTPLWTELQSLSNNKQTQKTSSNIISAVLPRGFGTHSTIQLHFPWSTVAVTEHAWSRNSFVHSRYSTPRLPTYPESSSGGSNVSCMCLNSRKKPTMSLLHFCTRPLTSAHTFLANRHFQSIWATVSGSWQQSSHVALTWTFLRHKLSLVGRHFERALHRNVRTLGGTLSFQILPHVTPCARTDECSAKATDFSLRATLYAVFTEKVFALFSVHTSVSWESRWFRGRDKICLQVLGVNVAASLPLSHCRELWSINSHTFILTLGSCKNAGAFGSHLWVVTLILLSSPIYHVDPSLITSLVASNDFHTTDGSPTLPSRSYS